MTTSHIQSINRNIQADYNAQDTRNDRNKALSKDTFPAYTSSESLLVDVNGQNVLYFYMESLKQNRLPRFWKSIKHLHSCVKELEKNGILIPLQEYGMDQSSVVGGQDQSEKELRILSPLEAHEAILVSLLAFWGFCSLLFLSLSIFPHSPSPSMSFFWFSVVLSRFRRVHCSSLSL